MYRKITGCTFKLNITIVIIVIMQHMVGGLVARFWCGIILCFVHSELILACFDRAIACASSMVTVWPEVKCNDIYVKYNVNQMLLYQLHLELSGASNTVKVYMGMQCFSTYSITV